jgi:hypothetical protein
MNGHRATAGWIVAAGIGTGGGADGATTTMILGILMVCLLIPTAVIGSMLADGAA